MKHRIGVKRIAEQAGVSVATVDRVLNPRPGIKVRAATAEKVLEAVNTLNQDTVTRLSEDRRSPQLRLALIIQSGASFNARLLENLRSFQQHSLAEDISIQEALTADLDTDAFLQQLKNIDPTLHGIILGCQETPMIRDAIDRLIAQGLPVVCVTTDLPTSKRLAYVGMDQYRAGRAAGNLIGRFSCERSGQVLLISSGKFRCQQEREIGFRQVLRESFPHLSVSESMLSGDDDGIAYEQARRFLETGRTPLAVYNVAGGNPGVLQALDECERIQGRLPYVCFDLIPENRQLLLNGKIDAVIDYDVQEAIGRAIQHLINYHHPDSYPLNNEPLAIRVCLADTV